jgi:hypothetical protein
MAEETGAKPQGKLVPLVWAQAGTPVFANHVLAQYDGSSVFLTFGQASPPLIWGGTEEEKQGQLDRLQSVAISPVIHLVMTPEKFREIVEVLQKHVAMMGKTGEADNSKQ